MLRIRWIVLVVIIGFGSIPVRYIIVCLTAKVTCVIVFSLIRMLKV